MSTLQLPQPALLWSHSAEDIKSQVAATLAAATAIHDAIVALPVSERTFSSVFTALAQAEASIANLEALNFYQFVSTDSTLRDAGEDAEETVNNFNIEKRLRADLFQVLSDTRNATLKTGATDLSPEDLRFMDRVVLDGKRAGLGLPIDQQTRLKALQKELDALRTVYKRNSNTEKGFVALARSELEGVPAEALASFKELDDGRVAVSHKGPDVQSVMTYAKNVNTRRAVWLSVQNKLVSNEDVFEKIVAIRRQLAGLLGYPTWADFITEEKMSKSASNVVDFLADLESRLLPIGKRDVAELLAFQSDFEGTTKSTLAPWDQSYYQNLFKERKLELDTKLIKEHFPVAQVVPAMLQVYQDMFSLDFVQLSADVTNGDVWHDDVFGYAVWERDATHSSGFLGYVFLDLYSRDDKFGGNAMWQLVHGHERADGSRAYPTAAIVANLSKPSPDQPALMIHFDAVQLFHEIGHVFHGLLSVTKYTRFHGTAGPTDWAEAPSQMLENWCWEPSVLSKISRHYQTGAPLSDELIQKLVDTRYQHVGLFMLNQVCYGKFDILAHIDRDSHETLTNLWGRLRREVGLTDVPEPFLPSHLNTTHWVDGYEAGYYGYAYSNVFAMDMYKTVFQRNPANQAAARRYRSEVLLPGASRDEMDIITAFLGRPPNSDAYFESLFGNSLLEN